MLRRFSRDAAGGLTPATPGIWERPHLTLPARFDRIASIVSTPRGGRSLARQIAPVQIIDQCRPCMQAQCTVYRQHCKRPIPFRQRSPLLDQKFRVEDVDGARLHDKRSIVHPMIESTTQMGNARPPMLSSACRSHKKPERDESMQAEMDLNIIKSRRTCHLLCAGRWGDMIFAARSPSTGRKRSITRTSIDAQIWNTGSPDRAGRCSVSGHLPSTPGREFRRGEERCVVVYQPELELMGAMNLLLGCRFGGSGRPRRGLPGVATRGNWCQRVRHLYACCCCRRRDHTLLHRSEQRRTGEEEEETGMRM
jgi:hypothetical protein